MLGITTAITVAAMHSYTAAATVDFTTITTTSTTITTTTTTVTTNG